jgi:DNA-binding response OmpR family regulator
MPEAGVYKILIVDDNAASVSYIKYAISRHPQFSIIVAYSAEDCFALIEFEKPDIVLLDISLPMMDGLTACQKIKKDIPTLPVIIMTADLDPEERFKAYQSGANDFIAKPFNAEVILSHIKHHLHLTVL